MVFSTRVLAGAWVGCFLGLFHQCPSWPVCWEILELWALACVVVGRSEAHASSSSPRYYRSLGETVVSLPRLNRRLDGMK